MRKKKFKGFYSYQEIGSWTKMNEDTKPTETGSIGLTMKNLAVP